LKRDPPWHGLIVPLQTPVLAAFVAFTLSWLSCATAHAQAKLTAHYTFTLAGITIGQGDWAVEIAKDHYTTKSSGQFSGIWRVLLGGDLSSNTSGSISQNHLVPATYEANFSSEDDVDDARMTFRDGTVNDYKTKPVIPPAPDYVPIAAADLRGATDPLTAGLLLAPAARDLFAPAACQRKLPIFDGSHRFDMALSFKRMDTVKAEKGYQGPAIVCAMTYQPIAGYSPTAFRVGYLKKRRDMEMWFAPIGSTRVLAVVRISMPTIFGVAILGATKFEGAVQ
jgi:Protein of unknown function (DUF3108)